jgi:hypothetical protein
MTGSFWWDLLLGIATALLQAWIALVIVLVIARPRDGLLREALRLLPDVLRLVRWPAPDEAAPRTIGDRDQQSGHGTRSQSRHQARQNVTLPASADNISPNT